MESRAVLCDGEVLLVYELSFSALFCSEREGTTRQGAVRYSWPQLSHYVALPGGRGRFHQADGFEAINVITFCRLRNSSQVQGKPILNLATT